MTMYFYTAHRNASGKIAKALEIEGHACSIYTNFDNFYNAVLNMKSYPDLLLFDHSGYDCSIFNIYRYMRDIRCLIPLIVYNTPFPRGRDSRLKHWIMTLNLYYGYTGTLDVDAYLPVLKTIADRRLSPTSKNYPHRSFPYLKYCIRTERRQSAFPNCKSCCKKEACIRNRERSIRTYRVCAPI